MVKGGCGQCVPAARPLMKKTYWHLPVAVGVTLGTVQAITALFGGEVTLPGRLSAGRPVEWILLAAVTLYGALLAERLVNARRHAPIRRLAFRLFSIVFLFQFFWGVFLSSAWLFGGEAALPHPAFLLLAPVGAVKGVHLFALWALSLLVAGPAFCSHLCWLGTWDHFAASRKGTPSPRAFPRARLMTGGALLAAYFACALLLPRQISVSLGFLFALGSVLVMILGSRRRRTPLQCGLVCPLGALTGALSRISIFRIEKASGKHLPADACPYGQFTPSPARGRLPEGCTLCGDCLDRASSYDLRMRLFALKFDAYPLFAALIGGLHAAFFLVFTP